MEEKKKKTLTIRVEPELLARFRVFSMKAHRSVNGQLVHYMRRAVALLGAMEVKARCVGESGDADREEMARYITGLVESGILSERALTVGVWVAEHQAAANQLLGLTPCGAEDCARLIKQLRWEGISELAMLAAYKQKCLEAEG